MAGIIAGLSATPHQIANIRHVLVDIGVRYDGA
jgi:hypothetical protein